MCVMRTVAILLLCLLIASLAGCTQQTGQEKAAVQNVRTLQDMAGRTVTIPVTVNKVYGTSPVATVMLYTIDPELLAGWSYHMASYETKFIAPKYQNLPVLEGWVAKNDSASVEEIMKVKPDIILLAKYLVVPADKVLADQIQEMTHIPVVVIDSAIEKMEQAYLIAGQAVGRQERTAQLANYCRETVGAILDKKQVLANRKPVTVYYAEGRRGLETEPRGSMHTEIIEFVGGVNVAGVDILPGGQFGRSPVSMEQVILWDPEVIFIGYFRDGESSSFPQIMGEREWAGVQAVKTRHVYEIPNYPFNWFDRPPSVNRLIGIKWAANALYPEIYPCDLRAEVQRFYELFYHYRLTEPETDALLQRTQQ